MSILDVCDLDWTVKEKTGADHNAASQLVLACYVGKLSSLVESDTLAVAIATGIRRELYGEGAYDGSVGMDLGIESGLQGIESGLSELADAVSDISDIASAIREHKTATP